MVEQITTAKDFETLRPGDATLWIRTRIEDDTDINRHILSGGTYIIFLIELVTAAPVRTTGGMHRFTYIEYRLHSPFAPEPVSPSGTNRIDDRSLIIYHTTRVYDVCGLLRDYTVWRFTYLEEAVDMILPVFVLNNVETIRAFNDDVLRYRSGICGSEKRSSIQERNE